MEILDSAFIIMTDEGKWYRKEVIKVISWGDWGVTQIIENKHTIFHIPSGFIIKHIKEKRYAKLMAKRLSQHIESTLTCSFGFDLNSFISWYVELMVKLDGIDLSIGLFKITDTKEIDEFQDIPF
ncbi:MAG: hypothetical protein GY870_08220 [archaeon]|nr:hypothetical protein [archaeon]